MRLKYLISATLLGTVCLVSAFDLNGAKESSNTAYSYNVPEVEKGLIEKCSLSCLADGKGKIRITAKTQASGFMKEIGCYNIKVQHSDDCENWTDELSLKDRFLYDTNHLTIDGLSVEVSGGYYYKVICTHYATGVPFMGTEVVIQNAENTSRPVWVDKIYEPVTTAEIQTATTQTSATTTTTTSTAAETVSTSATASSAPASSSVSAQTTAAAISAENTSGTDNNAHNTADSENKNSYSAGNAVNSTAQGGGSPITGVKYPLAALISGMSVLCTAIALRKNNKNHK